MKNFLLLGSIVTLICNPVYAEENQPVSQTQINPIEQPAQNGQQTPATNTQDSGQTVIDCNYKIPAETQNIDQSLVVTWSEHATVQAFDFDPASMEAQMQNLKTCFTDQGWNGFNSALQKSGNLEAIKSQNLTVSSQVDGSVQVTEAKDNQWKMTMPLQVVYQNDKEKVTQLLTINLTVGRKITGDLGIIQMIAAPRTVVTPQPTVVTPSNNNDTDANTTSTSPADANTTSTTPADANTTTTTPADANTTTTAPADANTTSTTPADANTTTNAPADMTH